MERIVESLRGTADTILYDSPPTNAATDAVVLAANLDAVLLVVSVGGTKRDPAVQAKQQLERVNAKIFGVVLNRVKLDRSVYRYYGK